jgi:hypothetical protein
MSSEAQDSWTQISGGAEVRLSRLWSTIATVGYTGSVSTVWGNRSAHGSVCHLQARQDGDGRIWGRRVNANGRHRETGERYEIDGETLDRWFRIAAASR